MLRNVIESGKVTEIVKVSEELKRGQLVVKNLANGTVGKADGVGVDVWVINADTQPTGNLSDVEVSAYDPSMDTIPANSYAVAEKYSVGGSIAVDQVDGAFVAGDYAVAGTTTKKGLFTKATVGKVSVFKFVGDYQDGDKVLKRFEIVSPVTV